MIKPLFYILFLAAPKNRPVTANRKTIHESSSSYSTTSSIELANAMAEENRKLEEFRGKQRVHFLSFETQYLCIYFFYLTFCSNFVSSAKFEQFIILTTIKKHKIIITEVD